MQIRIIISLIVIFVQIIGVKYYIDAIKLYMYNDNIKYMCICATATCQVLQCQETHHKMSLYSDHLL